MVHQWSTNSARQRWRMLLNLLLAVSLRIGRFMITRTQSISHQSRYVRILSGGACAAAIFGAASPWTLLDAPVAYAAPVNCPMSPSATPVCPAYIPSQPAPSACPVAQPGCPGYIPPQQALNNPANPPIWNGYTAPDGKPDKSEKPGSPPDGKPGSPPAGVPGSPPDGAPNGTDHSAPAPDAPAPAPAPDATDHSAPAPVISAPAPAGPPASAPSPVMSAPAPVMSAPAPAISMPSK